MLKNQDERRSCPLHNPGNISFICREYRFNQCIDATEMNESPIDLSGFCTPGTSCSQGQIVFSWGVSLNYYRFKPAGESAYPPVILVPGLVSVMENFRHLLVGITRYFEVYYLETAEKNSSIVREDYPYSIDALSDDLAGFIGQPAFRQESYILMGYSLGATVVMDACRKVPQPPALVVLGEPGAEFDFPWWSRLLARFIAPVFPLIRPGILWYIKHFRVNKAEDMEMYHIVRRALDSADADKLCRTVLAIADYKVWPVLPFITCPVLLFGTSLDTLHPYSETLGLARRISNCTLVDMETNERNHSKEVADVLLDVTRKNFSYAASIS
ncbi:MAG: alpha/beta hydrolase [Bacteroidales bacterium]